MKIYRIGRKNNCHQPGLKNCWLHPRRCLYGGSEGEDGEGGSVSEEAALAGLTDKFLWLFPQCALDLPDRSWKLCFFSFADDISKMTFPINTRKLYLELKNLNIWANFLKSSWGFLFYNVPFLWFWYNFGTLSMITSVYKNSFQKRPNPSNDFYNWLGLRLKTDIIIMKLGFSK